MAFDEILFAQKEDASSFLTYKAIIKKTKLDKLSDEYKNKHAGSYLKSYQEQQELYAGIPEALENTNKIAALCNCDYSFLFDKIEGPLDGRHWHLPTLDTKIGDAEKLKQVIEKELENKFSSITNEIIERIVYELKIIFASHYESYFLIIYDLASWAKKNNIRLSPGRGKAASSLVLYVLGITDINPLDYDLIFDLFFNEALPQGNPDLVLDFDFERPIQL